MHILAVALGLAMVAPGPSAPVRYDGQALVITVERQLLRDVLADIGRATGMVVEEQHDALAGLSVTAQLDGAPASVVTRLFDGLDITYAATLDPAGRHIQRLILFGGGRSRGANERPARAATPRAFSPNEAPTGDTGDDDPAPLPAPLPGMPGVGQEALAGSAPAMVPPPSTAGGAFGDRSQTVESAIDDSPPADLAAPDWSKRNGGFAGSVPVKPTPPGHQ